MATIKDKIGLAMLPSAQSGGENTTVNDFSGRVHSFLPIENTGPNIITNGSFDGTNGWTLPTGVTWNKEGYIDWNLSTGVLTTDYIIPFSKGNTYKVQFEIKNYQAGQIRWRFQTGNNTIGQLYSGDGVKTQYVTCKDSLNAYFQFFNGSAFVGSIANVSVQLISNGDFIFERSSAATRVGPDGYIKDVQVIGDELVQNGDFEEIGSELVTNGGFDTDSDWNVGAGWIIQNGSAEVDTDLGTAPLTQDVLTSGKWYKISYDVNITEGEIKFYGQTYISDVVSNTSSTSESFIFKASQSTILFRRNVVPTRGSIDNISVKEVGENWIFGTNTTISEENGSLKAKFNNASLTQIYQSGVILSGKKYRLTYDFNVISGSGGGVSVEGGGFNSGYLNESGTKTFDFETTLSSSLLFRVGGTPITATIDNVSVVEITDDTDIPRLDFSNTAQPSLLLEPQRTNLVTHSQDIENFSSKTTITVTPNAGISPSGRNDAFKLTATNNAARIAQTLGSANSLNVNDYVTASIWLKNISQTQVQFSFYDIQNVTSSGIDVTDQVRTDQWTRVSFTHQVTQATSNWQMQFARGGVDNGNEILVWNPQLEIGEFATSDILTNGSTVTRSQDVCVSGGDNTTFNASEGTLFFEGKFFKDDQGVLGFVALTNKNNRDQIQFYIQPGQILAREKLNNSYVASNSLGDPFTNFKGEYIKIAVIYHPDGNRKIALNGKVYGPYTNGSDFSDVEFIAMSFGASADSSSFPYKGNIRSAMVFNEALSDAELEKLTSSDITQVLRNYNRRGELLGVTYESTGVQTKLNELF